jgi:hypothetical protein
VIRAVVLNATAFQIQAHQVEQPADCWPGRAHDHRAIIRHRACCCRQRPGPAAVEEGQARQIQDEPLNPGISGRPGALGQVPGRHEIQLAADPQHTHGTVALQPDLQIIGMHQNSTPSIRVL